MESDLIPYTASAGLTAQSVLVLAPHPDDEVFGCGGAIAGHVHSGVPVTVVILTDGAAFGLASIRAKESIAAARVLGYGVPEFWAQADRGLLFSDALVLRILGMIARCNADLVYAPSPWELHPDHRQACRLAMEAVGRAGHHVRLAFYEVGAPLRPNALVDITPHFELKHKAMHCFASQLAQQDYTRHISALNTYRTYTLPGQVCAAEAFWLLSAAELARGDVANLLTAVSPGMVGSVANNATRAPLVSILIRSMDRDFLAQALDSVALQTYPNIEVLVISAQPKHRPLPDRCGPFPLHLHQTLEPLPRSRAANTAMAQAHGDLLLFLDDDDWLMPCHIARLANVLNHQPLALAAYTGISLVDALGHPLDQFFDLPFDPIRQIAGNLMPIHAVMFKASVQGRGCQFDETLDCYEDWDFWLQLAKLAPMVHLPGVSGAYRIHDSSGVHNDAGPTGAMANIIYQKWSADWSPKQIGLMMQRVWSHPELESHLADTRQWLKATELRGEALKIAISQKEQAISQQEQTISQQEQTISQQEQTISQQEQAISQKAQTISQQEQTISQQEQTISQKAQTISQQEQTISQKAQTISQQEQTISQQNQLILQHSSDHLALLNSHSWRITRPLRSLSIWLKWGLRSQPLRRAQRLRSILASEGIAGIIYRLKQHPTSPCGGAIDYSAWVRKYDTPSPSELELLRGKIRSWRQPTLISIVMPVYNPPLELLKEAIESIRAQIYPHWELCIADDASSDAGVWQLLQNLASEDSRIKVVRREINGHISQASNSALKLAQGEFVALMDNDDLLPPDALYWVAEAVNRLPKVQVIYSDEDKLDAQGQRFGPYFKPDWNYTLFLGHNLISHLGVYRTQLMREVGGFRVEFEGSQDYDLALRCIERVKPADIVHIPKVLYHWRAIEGSTAMGNDAKPYAAIAAQRALQEHRQRIGQACMVEMLPTSNYRCLRPAPALTDRLSVVFVATRNTSFSPTAVPAWTEDPAYGVHEVITCAADAAAINAAVAHAQGNLVALVRADLVPSHPDALLELVRHALEDDTGLAGGTVRDASTRLISGGLVLNPKSVATVLLQGLPHGNPGYMGRGSLAQELSAVSIDCVVMRKQIFTASGGLDKEFGLSQVGAVAFCLRLRENQLRVIWCPEALWTVTAGSPTLHETHQQQTFLTRFGQKYALWLACDPAYHPLLDAERADFSLQVLS